MPLAGVPYHAVDGYLKKMLQAGYKVAVCEQVEDPKTAKGRASNAMSSASLRPARSPTTCCSMTRRIISSARSTWTSKAMRR